MYDKILMKRRMRGNTLLCATVVSQLLREMNVTDELFFKVVRIALTALGLWPYQQWYFLLAQKMIFTSIVLTFASVQLLTFVTTEYSAELALKILSYVFPVIFIMTKYYLFVFQSKNMKKLLDQLRDDWNSLETKSEIDIIKKYSYYTSLLMVSGMTIYFLGLTGGIALQYMSVILDVILPLNESRPRQLLVTAEYMVDQEKYFHVLIIHEIVSGCIESFIFIWSSLTNILFVQHICALFKIARFIECLTISFGRFYTIAMIIGVISLSLSLFQFLHVITVTKNINDAMSIYMIICIQLTYMFVANYGGQQIINHGIQFFEASYNTLWYLAPLKTQKLLLFVMQNGTRNVTLTYDGMFTMSLEGFASLLSTAISYFTMIYSTRK